MKKSILKATLNFSVLALALCFSCGDKEDRVPPIEDKDEVAGGVLKMKVNDADWSAKWAYTITTPLDEEEDDHFLVFVTGATGEYTSEEDANGDALPFYIAIPKTKFNRSEEHTSELQSRPHLVCRLLLEKKNKKKKKK